MNVFCENPRLPGRHWTYSRIAAHIRQLPGIQHCLVVQDSMLVTPKRRSTPRQRRMIYQTIERLLRNMVAGWAAFRLPDEYRGRAKEPKPTDFTTDCVFPVGLGLSFRRERHFQPTPSNKTIHLIGIDSEKI